MSSPAHEALAPERTLARETFQARLDERLQQAQNIQITARLGVLIAGSRYLIELEDAGEIVAFSQSCARVPNTSAWVLGLTNLRGVLHCVTDLAAFMGASATPMTKEARLISVASRFGVNSALLVGRMLGLQNPGAWSEISASDLDAAHAWTRGQRPDWLGEVWLDADGKPWQALSIAKLLNDERFYQVQSRGYGND
jgi:chemotaxis signal transduction protein